MGPLVKFIEREIPAKMLAPEKFANGAWLEELPELLAMKRVFRSSVSAATECAALVQTSLLGRKEVNCQDESSLTSVCRNRCPASTSLASIYSSG